MWPGRPYGLQVTLEHGGSVYWMVSGASGVAPAADEDERLAPQPMPELGGGKVATAQVEQALLTALASGDTDSQIVRADRYSTRISPPAVGYGITVDTTDSWRLFVACAGTSRRGEDLRGNPTSSPTRTCRARPARD